MPKPQSNAHKAVAYDFSEIRMLNGFLREAGSTPKKSKRIVKRIANRGDRRQAKRELLGWLK